MPSSTLASNGVCLRAGRVRCNTCLALERFEEQGLARVVDNGSVGVEDAFSTSAARWRLVP
jgi:hypothetical protein